MTQDRIKRRLTAILSADIVGYSRLIEADNALEWITKLSTDDFNSCYEKALADDSRTLWLKNRVI